MSKQTEWIRTALSAMNPEAMLAEGFDDALIGISYNSDCAVYSVERCIDILVAEGMTKEDAIEHFDFNVAGSYVGEYTPIFVNGLELS